MKRVLAGLTAAGVALLAAGCASSSASNAGSSSSAGTSQPAAQVTLRLGFLENITHAPALIGVKEGFFTKNLGNGVTLKLQPFSTGTEEATALLAGQLDAAYVGPNPAIKAWQTSGGSLIKVISGAATGGAELVVKKGITSASQLKGQKLATPSLGNTQDVALRYWLKSKGLTTTETGGGDVPITPVTPNSAAVLQFASGQIAGGWEPAPYDAEMIADGGHVLVNEASLWPKGQFATTEVIVSKSFLDAHPAVVKKFLAAHVAAIDLINTNRAQAEKLVAQRILKDTTKPIAANLVTASFDHITFTADPIASSVVKDVKNAEAVGVLKNTDIKGIFDLKLLNQVLKADKQAAVSSP